MKKNGMNHPEFLNKMDWELLRQQKELLFETINNNAVSPMHKDALEGILATLDAIQDNAVDTYGLSKQLVFGDMEELVVDTGMKDADKNQINVGDAVKTIYLCSHCNSDNVQVKAWVLPNQNNQYACDMEDALGWCEDQQRHVVVDTVQLKSDAKVIGFQVVDDDEGDIHPDMDASFCVYSLEQANEMLEKDREGKYRLLTILKNPQ